MSGGIKSGVSVIPSNPLDTFDPLSVSNASDAKRKYIGNTNNVLNEYRSVTYNFTLAALKPICLKKPETYRKNSLDFVIARSAGKGNEMNPNAVEPIKRNIGATEVDDDGNPLEILDSSEQKELVKSFNKNSAGRFDFFIESAEFDTIMTPTQETGMALATKVKFEVIEPYSLNGFIDALTVSAKAAGHANHVGALYLFKVEFKGYPDSETGPSASPEVVDFATRYFPIRLTGIEVSVTEQGTKYICTAVPYNEMGFSVPNRIIADIQMSGNTVGEVLTSMCASLNKKIEERVAQEKDPEKKKDRDSYEIYFPVAPKPGESYDPDSIKTAEKNGIYNKPMNKILSENNVFKFPPPESGGYGNNAGGGRGSASAAASDPRLSDEQKAEILKQQEQEKMDATRKYNPGKVAIMFSSGANIHDIISAVIRDSEYMRDILADVEKAKDENGMIDYFKVHINTIPEMYDAEKGVRIHRYQYVVMPYKIHYTKLPGQKFTKHDTKYLNKLVKRTYNYLYTGENIDVLGFNIKFNNLYFQSGNPKMGNANSDGTATAAGATNDPKSTQPGGAAMSGVENGNTPAPAMEAVEEANSQDLRAGARRSDPYYMLAYNAHKTILESVDMIKGDMEILGDPYYLVTGGAGNYIPPAIDAAMTKDGEANIQSAEPYIKFSFRNPVDFDYDTGLMTFDEVADYSGIYRVIKCHSTFRDGVFKQRLEVLRVPGQIADARERPTKAYDFIEKPKEGSASVVDTASPDIARAGLKPNEFDLTKMIKGGLPTAGTPGILSNLQASGGFLGSVAAGAQAVGGVIQQGINSISKINQLSGFNLVTPGASATIDKIASGSRLAASGIGTVAALGKMVASQANSSKIPTTTSLVDNALDKVKSLQAGSGVAGLTNKLGIDTAQLSGLGGNLDSNVLSQLKTVTEKLPASVDITAAKESGLILSNLNANSLKNLPASLPKTVAPPAELELSDSLGSNGYMAALLNKIKEKTSQVTSSLPSLPNTQVAGNYTPMYVTDPVTGEQVRNYSEEDLQRMRDSNASLNSKLTNALGFGTTKSQDVANNAEAAATPEQQASAQLNRFSVDELKSKLSGISSSMGIDLPSDGSLPSIGSMADKLKSSIDPLSKLAGVNITPPSALTNQSALSTLQGAVNNVTDVATKFGGSSSTSPLDTLLKNKGIINA